jgi:hypothetical protein
MNESTEREETCAVCGNEATGGRRFSRLYHDGRPFPLCCPMCLDLFQRAPARFARGERRQTVLEELISDLKWRSG